MNTLLKKSLIFLILFQLWSTLTKGQDQKPSPLNASYEEHVKMKNTSIYNFQWTQLGPTLNSARVEAVQSDPLNPGTIYAAFGSGGLWKTKNNGLNWRPIFENMPSLGIGDIALAPSNSEIIYLGTGESLKKPRNFTMPGNGVYKSENGGENWRHFGLDDTWHIGEIAVHPDNPDIVVVAALGHFWSPNTNRGIFRSEDGGNTWDHVLFIDEHTGANDVVFSNRNPNILYATTWENYPNVHGKKSGVYKSNNGGKTWTKSINGINIDENTGRIGIATSYQDENKAYAFIDQRNRKTQGAGEIYKTLDGGETWKKTHKKDIHSLSVIGWYFMDIYVNPSDDEEIYGLGVRLLHSTNGGETFEYMGGQVNHLTPSPAQTLHLDHCEMWINPLNPQELLLGNDGGLFHSYDNGGSWLHLNNIPTGEFYDIELDNADPYTIYGGTQDDATVFGNAEEWNPKFNDTWKYLWIDAWSGGDGCITIVDPNDANTIYFSMQNGGARRLDLEADTSSSIRPSFPREDSIILVYNFITPYAISHFNSDKLYMAGNYLMSSNDRGKNWKRISPDLIQKKNHQKKEVSAGAFAESHFERGTLYVGTDRGTFWTTRNEGVDWMDLSEGLPDAYIRTISPSKHHKGRVYIQATGLNYDDFKAYAFVSENYGESWKSIKGNLPNHPINVIIEDPNDEDLLFAGTYRGVYFSKNRGIDWSYFGENMPDVSIADIEVHKGTSDLIVATHGRGIYKVNIQPLYDHIHKKLESNFLFSIPKASSPNRRDTHGDVEEQSITKVPITFWMEEKGVVDLVVTNAMDSTLWSKKLSVKKGFNQYRWDLCTKEVSSSLPYFIHYRHFLKPGTYEFQLKNSRGVLRREWEVD